MIEFVNAKINIGLYVTGKREDGYHTLATCFYPVGRYNGLPQNPEPFCDMLEITPISSYSECEKRGEVVIDGLSYLFTGNVADCSPERNLVVRAGMAFQSALRDAYPEREGECSNLLVHLEKHLPFGAGLGGGSADATFTLRMLNKWLGTPFDDARLEAIAVTLGADCPFFVKNHPIMARGIGEIFTPASVNLQGYWCAIIKPSVNISTAEAFRGVKISPEPSDFEEVLSRPVCEWRGKIHNAFEDTLFPLYPVLGEIKNLLYDAGAEYASMSGSGASIYGLFAEREAAQRAIASAPAECYTTLCLL